MVNPLLTSLRLRQNAIRHSLRHHSAALHLDLRGLKAAGAGTSTDATEGLSKT
jgi:hypothetical protein